MKKNSDTHFLISGIASLSFAALFTKFIGVLYKVPLSYILNDEGMGYFNVAYTVFSFFYILSASGIPKAITIVFSDKSASDYKNYVISMHIIKVFTLAGIILTIIFLLMSPTLSLLLGSEKSVYSMLLIGPSIAFITLGGILKGFLTSKSALLPIAISQIIEALSKLVLGLLFALIGVKINMSLQFISAFTILGITFGSIFSSIYLLYNYKIKFKCYNKVTDFESRLDCKTTLKRVISVAIPITLSSSILSITNIIDLGIIMQGLKFIGYSESQATSIYGNYSTLSVPMLNLVIAVLSPISVALLPKLINESKNDVERYDKTIANAILFTNIISAPVMLSFFFYSFDLLDILFESNSSLSASSSLQYLAPAMYILPLLTLVNTILESSGKIGHTVISLSIGAIIKIIVTYCIIHFTNLGILAASIGTIASYLTSLVLSYRFVLRLKNNVLNFYNTITPLIVSITVFLLIPKFLANYLCFTNSKINSIILISLSFIIYFLFFITINCIKCTIKRVIINKKTGDLLSN